MGHNWQTGETITAALLNGVAQVADIGTPGTPTGDALKAALDARLTVATAVTANTTAAADTYLPVNAASGAVTVTLPTGQAKGATIVVEKEDTSTNAVAVSGSIRGGASTVSLVWQFESITLVADAAGSWWPRSGHKTKASLDATYVPIAGPSPSLRRDFRMQPPRVLTSPPATTAGASGSSTVAGSVFVSCFEPGAFAYLGGRAVIADYANPSPVGVNMGTYPYKTSAAPVTVEFWLDTVDATGRFEVYWSGPSSFTGMRVAVQQGDGSWGYVSAAATFSHTSGLADLVTLGAAGTYKIRLEFAGNSVFCGVYVGPTDTVTGTRAPKRWIVVGDSFTEPTIDDTGSFVLADGWVPQLAYLTGYDLWAAGSGGTGYLNPNTGGGRVKFRDRLAADVFAFQPDGILWAGGINDPSYLPSDVGAEALACFQAAKAAGVPEQVVVSPWWAKTLTTNTPTNVVAMADAIKASALSMGLKYLNLLEMPEPTGRLSGWTGSTLQASVGTASNTISVASVPAYFAIGYVSKGGWYVKIGTGANTEIRKVTNISGTGPYTLAITSSTTYAWAAGTPVVLSGAQYMTGSGKQGSVTGSGNSDRYTGAGGTHPTKAGHAHIARTIAGLWAQALTG